MIKLATSLLLAQSLNTPRSLATYRMDPQYHHAKSYIINHEDGVCKEYEFTDKLMVEQM